MPKFVMGEEGHVVPLIYPKDVTGGATGETFSMREWEHATITVVIGASAGALTRFVVSECTGKDAAGAVPIAYAYYACETTGAAANCDVLGVRQAATSAGIDLSETDNIFYVIDIDAAQLSDGYEWIYVNVTSAAAANFLCAVAHLSGARYGGSASRTVLDN
jgi:hypothetical protein